jgi:tRNA threonylcarbamoyladenosine biosynthesis protein TsaB
MRILAFDTATRATAVALTDGRATLERRDDPAPGERPRHATRLLPLVSELLSEAGIGWSQVDRIAVGLGPGTFTGLRIGVATAQALARAATIPVVGVSTLHSLALNLGRAPGPQADVVVAVLDARRSEVYAAAWDANGLGKTELPALLRPAALAPESLLEALAGRARAPLAIGEGAIAFRGVLEHGGMSVPEDRSELHRITAAGHCLIARDLEPVEPGKLAPDYQRLPDAQPRSTAPTPERADGR